jgi:hypothetical protein
MISLSKPFGRKRHICFTSPLCIHGHVAFSAQLKYKHYAIRTLFIYHHMLASSSSLPPLHPGMNKQMRSRATRLEGVVLGGDLVVVEVADEGDLLEDVGLDARDAVEEEEGEDAGRDTEGGADGAPVLRRWR